MAAARLVCVRRSHRIGSDPIQSLDDRTGPPYSPDPSLGPIQSVHSNGIRTNERHETATCCSRVVSLTKRGQRASFRGSSSELQRAKLIWLARKSTHTHGHKSLLNGFGVVVTSSQACLQVESGPCAGYYIERLACSVLARFENHRSRRIWSQPMRPMAASEFHRAVQRRAMMTLASTRTENRKQKRQQ